VLRAPQRDRTYNLKGNKRVWRDRTSYLRSAIKT
jgi:hypothetical protein